jgi:hypothetical protein
MIDFTKVEVTSIEGIDMSDYPKFCDAYVSEALIDGEPATEAELEEIQENSSFFYDALTDFIH